jgi:hypothetical protein
MPVGTLPQPLFESTEVLEAELAGPLTTLIENMEDREELPFTITAGGVSVPVAVRVRGNSRLRVCSFPPLRLDFEAKDASASVFAGQDKLKLVTHCSDRRRDAGNVYDEYLAYLLYNLVSDYGYRVRLVSIRYADSAGTAGGAGAQQAFLIESDKEFAARHGATTQALPGVVLSKMDEEQAARTFVFEYLIGNTDWSLVTADTEEECCHNIDLFELKGRTLLVPYDFDLAGLVDASYAKPDPALKMRNVRTRRYRGYCVPVPVLADALEAVIGQRDAIMETAAAVPAADADALAERVEYLEEFFTLTSDRERVLKDYEKRCLK